MIDKKMSASEIQFHIKEIKIKLLHGADYKQCQAEAQPYIDLMNKRGEAISKKFGFRHSKITFQKIMR